MHIPDDKRTLGRFPIITDIREEAIVKITPILLA